MIKTHVKKGDEVKVISGKWKKERAKITAVLIQKQRVVLELIGLSEEKQSSIGMRSPPRGANRQAGRIARAVSVHISNVARVNEN